MKLTKLTNWNTGFNYFTPNVGLDVWWWDDGDATRKVVEDTRSTDGHLEVFLGMYRTTKAGKEWIKENKIYLNECCGNKLSVLLEKFTQPQIDEHFKMVWCSSKNISLPNSRDRLMQRIEWEEMLKKLNELMVGENKIMS